MKVYIVEHKEKTTSHISDVLFPLVMQHEYGIKCSYSDIRRDDNGKPQPISGHFFNISHSDNYWCIVFSNETCGIDIENSNKTISPRLLRRILAPGESPLHGTPLETWVFKEAYAKYLGQGIALNFRDISANDMAQKCFVKNLSAESYFCYVAQQKSAPVEIIRASLVDNNLVL